MPEKNKNIVLLFVLALSIFIQLCLLHIQIFNSILVSSLWKEPFYFFNFYIPRVLFAVGVSLFLLTTRRKWWTIVCVFVQPIISIVISNNSFVFIPLFIWLVAVLYCLSIIKLNNVHHLPILKWPAWQHGVVLISMIFLQCILFNITIFHQPALTIASIGFKLSIACFITSWIFLCKSKLWSIIISFLLSLWMIAEMMYFRANGFFLDASGITMLNNMDGWRGSLKTLVYVSDVLLILPLILLVIESTIWRKNQRNVVGFIIAIASSLILNFTSCFALQTWKYPHLFSNDTVGGRVVEFNPFSSESMMMLGVDMEHYVKDISVVHVLIYNAVDLNNIINEEPVILSEDDYLLLNNITKKETNAVVVPQSKLIICLIESFENWVITSDYMPNLYTFIHSHGNVLYASGIESQVAVGTSADGQMIVNTGLLPIKKGAACFRCCYNTYPSLSEIYSSTCGIFPHPLSVWNQTQMCKAYKIDSNYVVSHSDKVIFSNIIRKAEEFDYILAITSSTHNPFEIICDSSNLVLDAKMPKVMQRYIKSFNYFDESIACFLKEIDANPVLKDATIVITADHKIFNPEMREQFADYCMEEKLSCSVDSPYCPLIVYSPAIQSDKPLLRKSHCYQMDIYPTVLSLIGGENYYWQGVGVNILDDYNQTDELQRSILEIEAKDISDKLIRSNYFTEFVMKRE